jgi:glycerol-3-phosphate dehydrogenase (NAD(P)+)
MASAQDDDLGAISTIGVGGAGAWGLALANAAARAGRRVVLWGRDAEAMRALARTRRSAHLPGAVLATEIVVSEDIGALAQCEAALVVVPAQATRALAGQMAKILRDGAPLVACAKGIELGSGLFMTDVLAQAAPGHASAILSGPSFAGDVAAGLPTAVTLACADEARARALTLALNSPSFRLYHSNDVRGVEIGGAAKNVLAIACGIASGLGLGPSAGAALVARGFAELSRFGAAFGARPQTLMGLSGLGDLVLTCTSPQSRNFAFGLALGRGASAAEASAGKLAEGATTVRALLAMARAQGVEMPISVSVAAVLEGQQDVRAAVGKLLARPARAED